jgi:hypothetical protein
MLHLCCLSCSHQGILCMLVAVLDKLGTSKKGSFIE